MDGMRLKQVSEFKYLANVLNESDTDVAECRRKLLVVYGSSDKRGENGDGKDGSEISGGSLLYADDLVLCSQLEEDLKVIVDHFVKVYRRRGLKVS